MNSVTSANHYYAGNFFFSYRLINLDSQEFDEEMLLSKLAYKKLNALIKTDNLSSLIDTDELRENGIDYRYGEDLNTLLHLAYKHNRPNIVKYLLENGADERIPNDVGKIPIEETHEFYNDSLSRVINEVVHRYFKSIDSFSLHTHHLFGVILNFIIEKKWKYVDTEGSRKNTPFRDGRKLSFLGLPHLSYNVNCADLTNLFIKSAQKIGLEAKEIEYISYKSIHRAQKEENGVIGEMAIFDRNRNFEHDSKFKFDVHYVAYSCEWYYDLTLMCRYQHQNAILS